MKEEIQPAVDLAHRFSLSCGRRKHRSNRRRQRTDKQLFHFHLKESIAN
jgi:hypothetical protein